MNVLYLTLSRVWDINDKGLYHDLLRELMKNDCNVYVVAPAERRYKMQTEIKQQGKVTILTVKTLNVRKTNIIEKGIGTVLLDKFFIAAIKKYFPDVHFDLVLYSTPPITLAGVVKYIKRRDNAKTYLLLKDIFPQNAVDIGMLKKSGIKGLIYKYFRRKEKMLYRLSDRVGCMSQANVDYVLEHNAEVPPDIVEVCPNSIEVLDVSLSDVDRLAMRQKYGIPSDKTVFVYGGNLGRPQGVPFVIDCLKVCKNEDAFFLIVGDGTEYGKLSEYIEAEKPQNVKLMKALPKDDYDRMLAACDVGLIFLDHRFTIPNFPSRLLTYMQARLPVIAATDVNTDIGRVIVDGGFGWWCESNDADSFRALVKEAFSSNLTAMGSMAFEYLLREYSVSDSAKTILQQNAVTYN